MSIASLGVPMNPKKNGELNTERRHVCNEFFGAHTLFLNTL